MRTWILGILLFLVLAVCLEAKEDEKAPSAVAAAVEPKDAGSKLAKRKRNEKKRKPRRRGNGTGHKRERRKHRRSCHAGSECGPGQKCKNGKCRNMKRRGRQ